MFALLNNINSNKRKMLNKMKVEIWSDITCTYCYTAKRKFESALAQFINKDSIHVIWKSFELAPDLKTDPAKNLPHFLAELNGISIEQAGEMTKHVANSAKQVGLILNFDKTIPANSFHAHRLSHMAKHRNLQSEAEERLFSAYFTEGRNIDDIPTLVQLAIEIGLDPMETQNVLESNLYTEEVRKDLQEARESGITSVPFFVLNGKLKVSGAQDSKVFLEILERSFSEWRSENTKSDHINTEGLSCKIGEDCK
jgi:predicted DsbA family dithiol-disulfide isomerase